MGNRNISDASCDWLNDFIVQCNYVIKGDYMEHRWSKRFDVNVDVSLYHRGEPVIECATSDAGTGGIFINHVPQTVEKNTFLEVEFKEGSNLRYKRARVFRLRALVMHSSNKGVGLMFLKSDPETLLAWRQVMRKARHQPSISDLAIKKSSFYPELSTDYIPTQRLIAKSLK